MKYLLAFLISFNLFAVCQEKTVEEINACTIELLGVETQLQLDQWKSSQLEALTERERYAAQKLRLENIGGKFGKHKSFYGLEKEMILCGFNESNKAIFVYKTLLKKGNETMIDCLELKKPEVDAEKVLEQTKKNAKKLVNTRMKSADCSSLQGQVLQDMCNLLKE